MGAHELATQLKVPESTLETWIDGGRHMPDRNLRMLSLILVKWAAKPR